MKYRAGQVSLSRSREGRREATAHANRIKASTRLADYPNFGRDYGEWDDKVAGYFTYSHYGTQVKLRFSHDSCEWTARARGIETHFPHQAPEALQVALNEWIVHLSPRRPTSPQAQLRQSTQAVQEFAARHNISVALADEIMLERGF